jgi:hypothetical protein
MLMKSDNSRLTSAKEPGRGYHDLGGLDAGPIDTDATQAKRRDEQGQAEAEQRDHRRRR